MLSAVAYVMDDNFWIDICNFSYTYHCSGDVSFLCKDQQKIRCIIEVRK